MADQSLHRQDLPSVENIIGKLVALAGSAALAVAVTQIAFWATPAKSQNATWLAAPVSGNFNTNDNWSTGVVPTDTAFFGSSNTTSLTFSAATTIGGWTFNAGADAYDFTVDGLDLEFNGAGIVVNGGSVTVATSNNGTLIFVGTSTAGNATINNDNGFVNFIGSSTAGNAIITNSGDLTFVGTSTAGSATITNNDLIEFLNSSTAGNATITNNAFLDFTGSSTAGNATITNNSSLNFVGTSTAGNATIINNFGGVTDFSTSTGPLADGKLTAGSFAGAGTYFLGANELTVGGDNLSTDVFGVISDCGPTGSDCQNTGATGGSLVKTGNGTFTLSGANTYTGPSTVNGGTLLVNGSIVSDVTVNTGGTLGGIGSVGATTIDDGGTIAPGNSIGTMTVNGPFTLGPGAIYEAEVNAAGQGDQIIVNGTVNLTGATLQVLATSGDYASSTDYVIIDNDGTDAVVGEFAEVSTNLAFLSPTVLYDGGDGNDVVLKLVQVSFSSVAQTPNQRSVALALDQFPTDHPLFLAVLTQTAAGGRQAFDALSGEIHGTVAGTLARDSRYTREAVLGRLMQASHSDPLAANGPQVASLFNGKSLVDVPPERGALAFWTQGFGAWADIDSDGNAASASRDLGGFLSGMDADIGGTWRAGLATGASFTSVDVDARSSAANVETYHLGGYVGGMVGGLALRGGGLYAWNSIDTSRAVVFPGFFERQNASYDADTGQLFGEVAYPTQMGGIVLEPFGGIAFVSVDSDGFRERGGALASLRGEVDQDVGYTTLGLRAATTTQWGDTQVTPHISAAWQHAFDDVTPGASLAFATTGIGFGIDGVPLAEDAALIDAGLDLALGENGTAGVSYSGQFGDGVTDNAVKGRVTWLF